MTTRCPTILPVLVIADDARLAAQISCRFATPGAYLPVLGGPAVDGSDQSKDVVRKNDAALRAKPSVILLAGLADGRCEAIGAQFAPVLRARFERIKALSDLDKRHRQDLAPKHPPLRWGHDRIGVGLLKALRNRCGIAFADHSSPTE